MLELKGLRMLREVQRRGTLAAVAVAMSYSPATISQQLSQLEIQAGAKLLEPFGRGVRLTAEAEILVRHTEVILEELEKAEAELAEAREEVLGTLHVAIFQSAALALLPQAIESLAQRFEGLRVNVVQLEPEDALERLGNRAVDVAITQEYPTDPLPRSPQIELVELFRDRLRLLACPHERASSLENLRHRPWVIEPEGTPPHTWVLARCRSAGFEPEIRYVSNDLVVHRRLIEAGHAVGFLPDLSHTFVPWEYKSISFPDPQAFRSVYLTVRRGSASNPRIAAFREAISDAATHLEGY